MYGNGIACPDLGVEDLILGQRTRPRMLSLILSGVGLLVTSRAAVHAPVAPRSSLFMAGNLFKVQDITGAKAAPALEKFHARYQNIIAKGPNPSEEAWQPVRRPQVKQMSEMMLGIAQMAAAADACATPLGADDPVGTDPESERASRTRVLAANSFTGSAAISLVSYWPDHVSVDACGINPGSLSKGEMAEKAILRHVAAEATERGCNDIRLALDPDKFFQNGGDEFYEPAGFFPVEGAAADEASVLKFREGFVAENQPLPN